MEMIKCPKTHDDCYGFREINLLYEISTWLIRSNNIAEELPHILKRVCLYLGAESAFLTVLERNEKKLIIEAAYGLSPVQQSRGKYKIGEGIIGKVVETERAIVIPEISKSDLFINKTKQQKRKDGKELTFVCVPLFIKNKIAGTLSTTRVKNDKIAAEESMRFLSVIGNLITQAVRTRRDKLEEIELLKSENKRLNDELHRNEQTQRPINIIGNSGKMQDLYQLIGMVAGTNSTVLIRGESGCGKELVADAIHQQSNRKDKPLIKVNCSALPESLIESELFGHEKGAFTGADQQRKGRFELAQGGTIFLDEIGDLPLTMQVKLLRTIQQRELERVGGTQTIRVDVRIICATNRNLEEMIQKDEFREDFFYRINVFPLFLPALRERRNDIPMLVDHFIEKYNRINGTHIKRITTSAIKMLMVYSWPGNIRELENVIERAGILSTDGVIHSHQLPPTLQTAESSNTQSKGGLPLLVESLERQLITEALVSTEGNISKAATELKVTERQLGTRIQKYGIEVWRFKV